LSFTLVLFKIVPWELLSLACAFDLSSEYLSRIASILAVSSPTEPPGKELIHVLASWTSFFPLTERRSESPVFRFLFS
jgi:hypothetical protein